MYHNKVSIVTDEVCKSDSENNFANEKLNSLSKANIKIN